MLKSYGMQRLTRRFARPKLLPLIRRPADPFSPKLAAAIHNSTAGKNEDKNNYKNNNTRYERRKVLPAELWSSPNVVKLTCDSMADGGVCNVYLVGTSQFSEESCEEVKAVIDFVKPQAVFLQLCESRRDILVQREKLKVPTTGIEMLEMWMKKNQYPSFIIYPSLIIYHFYLEEVARKRDVIPGAEFRVAWEEARKYGGEVFLGDRPIQITVGRTQVKRPIWNTIKHFYYGRRHRRAFPLAYQDLSNMLNKDTHMRTIEEVLKIFEEIDKRFPGVQLQETMFQSISKCFPSPVETIGHERDQWMSYGLLKIASTRNSVVAVVGKYHLSGIQKNWKQPVDIEQLRIIPPKRNTIPIGKIIKYVGVPVAGAAIIRSFL